MTAEQAEQAITWLLEGRTYKSISEELNVPMASLHAKLSSPEYSARAREALIISADVFADKAEQVLIESNWDPNMGDFSLKKARELSQYYKWKASKRNPKNFGDKIDVHQTGEMTQNISLSQLTFEQLKQLTGIDTTGSSEGAG